MSPNRIWIMDGHNMIFTIPPLRQLQVSDRREEARAGLVDRLERFALARSEKVLVVFDGNTLPSNPDAVRKPLFETVYTPRGEGAADARILRDAARCLEQGLVVTVVTNDLHTLARKLPRGARHLRVEEFWLAHLERHRADGAKRVEEDKRVEGDFSDLEREMLAQAAAAEPAPRVRPAGVEAPRALTEQEATREQILRKRERGRLRQGRRLERRSTTPARRR